MLARVSNGCKQFEALWHSIPRRNGRITTYAGLQNRGRCPSCMYTSDEHQRPERAGVVQSIGAQRKMKSHVLIEEIVQHLVRCQSDRPVGREPLFRGRPVQRNVVTLGRDIGDETFNIISFVHESYCYSTPMRRSCPPRRPTGDSSLQESRPRTCVLLRPWHPDQGQRAARS